MSELFGDAFYWAREIEQTEVDIALDTPKVYEYIVYLQGKAPFLEVTDVYNLRDRVTLRQNSVRQFQIGLDQGTFEIGPLLEQPIVEHNL